MHSHIGVLVYCISKRSHLYPQQGYSLANVIKWLKWRITGTDKVTFFLLCLGNKFAGSSLKKFPEFQSFTKHSSVLTKDDSSPCCFSFFPSLLWILTPQTSLHSNKEKSFNLDILWSLFEKGKLF